MERFTDKMTRVIANMQAMADYNAPESDIAAYMQEEGVTPAQLRQFASIEAAPVEKPGVLARVGRGVQDVVAGAGQLTGALPQVQQALTYLPGGYDAGSMGGMTDAQAQANETADMQRYEGAMGPGTDWGRIAGQALMTAPLAAPSGMAAGAGLLGRAALGAAAGGASGGILYAPDSETRAMNALGGAAGGALFGGIAPSIIKGAGTVAGKAKDVAKAATGLLSGKFQLTITREMQKAAESAGIPLDELGEAYQKRVALKAREALKAGQPFDFEAEMRAARAAKFGFEGDAGLLRGQATRDPKTFSQQMNLSKRPEGAPIAERMNNQLAQAEAYMDDLAKVPDLDPVEAGDGLRLLSKARADAMQAEVRDVYKAVPKGGEFSPDSLASRTDSILTDFEDKISSGVKSRIKSFFGDKPREASMEELIKLDKLISETMPAGDDAAVNKASEALKKAVLGVMDDAADSQGDESVKAAYKAAKAAAKKRFDMIGPQGGLVSQLVHGKVDPTQIPQKIMTGKVDDLRRLKTFIMSESEKGPVDRWETIKRMVENQIQNDARPGGQFSQAAYDKAISKIGKNRLTEIFGEQRTKELFEFRDVARDVFRYPNFHSINTSNTAPEAANIVGDALGAAANLVPGGQVALGLLQRAGKKKAQTQAQKEVERAVIGLLGTQPLAGPRANPAMRLLPYAGASAGLGGLLAASKTRQ